MACSTAEKWGQGTKNSGQGMVIRGWNVWCVRSGPSSRHQDRGHCAATVLRGHLRKTKENKRREKGLHAIRQVWLTCERQEQEGLQTEASSPKEISAKSWGAPTPKSFTEGPWMSHECRGYLGYDQSRGIAQEKHNLLVNPGAESLGKQEGLSQPAFPEQLWEARDHPWTTF